MLETSQIPGPAQILLPTAGTWHSMLNYTEPWTSAIALLLWHYSHHTPTSRKLGTEIKESHKFAWPRECSRNEILGFLGVLRSLCTSTWICWNTPGTLSPCSEKSPRSPLERSTWRELSPQLPALGGQWPRHLAHECAILAAKPPVAAKLPQMTVRADWQRAVPLLIQKQNKWLLLL